jgi:hypothetical protein
VAAKKGSESKETGPPPLPGKAGPPPRAMSLDRIEVDSKWLIKPVEKKWQKVRDVPLNPQHLPSSLAVKPRGQLPPPLPREDEGDGAGSTRPGAATKSAGRTSRRPPPPTRK